MSHLPRTPAALALMLFTACGQGTDSPAPTRVTSGGSAGHSGNGGVSAGGATNGAGKGGHADLGGGGSVASGAVGGSSRAGGGAGGANATIGGASSVRAGAGSGGTGGSDQSGGEGGTAGQLDGAGQGGAGGIAAGSSGNGGSGGATTCTITAQATQSATVPTVETVTWTTTQTGVESAEIDFGPAATGPSMVAPVDLTAAGYATVLVGMKPSSSYVYRIKSTSAAGTCTSQDYPVATGALSGAPTLSVTISDAAHHDRGFIVASSGLNGTSGYIIDPDGTVVWLAPSGAVPGQPSRVHLSWDAKRFIAMSLNVQNTGTGQIHSVALDGSDAKTLSDVAASHHDFTAIPGGIATLLWNTSVPDAPCSLVELPDGGSAKTIVADMAMIYTSSSFHTNAVHYCPSDDSYTLGDRNPNLFAKVSRTGQLVWQLGGSSPKDASKLFSGVTNWQVNHGHHLRSDGTFVFFNNGTAGASAALVYRLDAQTMTATYVTKFSGVNSMVLGDAQALPNGNFLITGSTSGTIEEVTAAGSVVMKITAPSGQQFGYSEFRESLYGPPPY
jgi:hypothetical protein